jgi:putative membrane protein
MKTLYTWRNATYLMAFVLLVSCSSSLSYREAMNRNARKIHDAGRLDDANFLVDAKSFNMLEMKLAEAAVTNGYASAIVDLARKHLDQLKDMNDDLNKIARKEKIAMPESISEKHQLYLIDVTKADKQDFDKQYIQTIQRINEENKEQYMRMATDGKDADIRAFAARKLDMLKSHADELDEAEKKLMNTY